MYRQGGSPGGARPKITVARYKNEIVSGFEHVPDKFEHWIIKFRSLDDSIEAGKIEYVYSKSASLAGINFPNTELIEVNIKKKVEHFFAVKRFDRQGNKKIHMHSLAGLLYANFREPCMDYDDILKVVNQITTSYQQVEDLYRLMVFNVLSGNKDDHVKNFSFLYDSSWKLSPAFDLTFSSGMNSEHNTSVNGSGNPTIDDLLLIGREHSIKNGKEIIEQVQDSINQWSSLSKEINISKKTIQTIQKSLNQLNTKSSSPKP